MTKGKAFSYLTALPPSERSDLYGKSLPSGRLSYATLYLFPLDESPSYQLGEVEELEGSN